MHKLKNAPNMKQQPKDAYSVRIVVGSQAWDFVEQIQRIRPVDEIALDESLPAGGNNPPIVLDDKVLADISGYRIAPESVQDVVIFRANKGEPLAETAINAICENLARHTTAKIVEMRDEAGETLEVLSGYIERLRNEWQENRQNAPQDTENKTAPYIAERTHENGTPSLYRISPRFKDGEALPDKLEWLADKIQVLGRGRGCGSDFAIVEFTPSHSSQAVKIAVPFNQLGDKTGWQLLADKGLAITTKAYLRNDLADWITQNANGTLWGVTHSAGWQNGAYVLPNGEMLADTPPLLIVRSQSANKQGYTENGTVDEWRTEIAECVKGNPLMMLSVAVAFSAPLLKWLKAESFGVHFFGASTAGKTTTANIGASVWGDPTETLLSWNGTAYGLENEAHARNDGLMVLDEIGQAEKRAVLKTAYTLFNGKGKLQGAKDGGNREQAQWRICLLSTGEQDFETYLNRDETHKTKANAGQLVRFLNIPFEPVAALHGFETAKAHADHLNESVKRLHGAAGREWAKWLSVEENQQKLTACYAEIKAKWINRLPTYADGQIQRVAGRFAILETALQLASYLTGWTESENAESVLHCFNLWLADFGLYSKERQQIIEQANAFLLTQTGARCLEYPDNLNRPTPLNLAGYHILADGGSDECFYIFPDVYRNEVINGFNERQASQILEQAQMLERETDTAKGYQVRIPRKVTGKKHNIKAYKLFYFKD